MDDRRRMLNSDFTSGSLFDSISAIMQKPDAKYCIPAGFGPSQQNELIREFVEIAHVTHVRDAGEVIRRQSISARLVGDESCLKGSDIAVVWMSPNQWKDGFMYGTFAFRYPLSLLQGKHMYYVEVMSGYSPPAIRILVSSRHYPGLWKFDPTVVGHPLYCVGGHWFRVKEYNCEIMIDEDVPLRDCIGTGFVDHHHSLCNRYKGQGWRCSDLGKSAKDEALEQVSLALSTGDAQLIKPPGPNVTRIDPGILAALQHLDVRVYRRISATPFAKESAEIDAAIHDAIAAYGAGNEALGDSELKRIGNGDDSTRAYHRLVRRVLGESFLRHIESAPDPI